MTRPPLAERINRADVHAFVALDTIDLLVDHMVGLIGQNRRFTILDQYLSDRPTSLHDTGWRAQTSLRLDPETRYAGDGAHRWEQRCFPTGKGVTFYTTPGLGAFGISVYDLDHEKHNRTEEAAAAYYHAHQSNDVFSRRRNVALVRMQGWPGQPSRSDRILIEDWNDHGVCRETLVLFEDHR